MYVESKEELMVLLKLVGYAEKADALPGWRPTMVDGFAQQRPKIFLLWVNGCQIHGVDKFLTFTEAWQYISDLKVE